MKLETCSRGQRCATAATWFTFNDNPVTIWFDSHYYVHNTILVEFKHNPDEETLRDSLCIDSRYLSNES